MCLSRAGRVAALSDGLAEVERQGRRVWMNALLTPECRVGDWVVTHTGLVVAVVSETEARELEEKLAAVGDIDEDLA